MNTRDLKVLLLEDNPDHAELIQNALNVKGECFQVEICSSKSEFMTKVHEKKYDAFLVDYNIPSGDSMEILEEILALGDQPPVIFISGTDNEEIITQVLHAGAADFVIKSRTSLKTLPIILKRNIIRKMVFRKRAAIFPFKPGSLFRTLEESLKIITQKSSRITQHLRKGSLDFKEMEEIQRMEELLEKTTDLLKKAKNSILPTFSGTRKKEEKEFKERI